MFAKPVRTMSMHTVCTEGEDMHRLFYRLYGNLEAPERIIFNMGLGGDHYQWEPQIEFFKDNTDYCICVYDNRGMGFSDPVNGRWTTKAMAHDALSLLNHLQWKDNVHVVGLSLGGMVSQQLVLLDLPRFVSLCLISTAPGGIPSLSLLGASLPTGVKTLLQIFTASTPQSQLKSGLRILYPESFLDKLTFNEEKGEEEPNYLRFRRALIKRGVRTKEEGMPPIRFKSIVKQAGAVTTHRTSWRELRRMKDHFCGKALVITGDEDILISAHNSVTLKHALDSKLVILAEAGHGANEQYAERVNEAILSNMIESSKL